MSKGALFTLALAGLSLSAIGYQTISASRQAAETGFAPPTRNVWTPERPAAASDVSRIDWRDGEALYAEVSVEAPWPIDVREATLRETRETMAWLASQGPADYYVVSAFARLRDGLGNAPRQRALTLELPASTAAQINWQGITEMELLAACIRDGSSEMHPALER